MTNRVEASQRRTDTRQWVVDRRERTRHLIELGGLVVKAGLVELTEDDRAVILGALFHVAAKLRSESNEEVRTRWRRRGMRAFAVVETDQQAMHSPTLPDFSSCVIKSTDSGR